MGIDLEKSENKKQLLDALDEKFNQSRMNYYRYVIRKEDEATLKKLLKVPDNWGDFKTRDGGNISEEQQKRLSDLKSKKSWELKFESLYIYFMINIENTLNLCFRHKSLTLDEIEEAIDSLNTVLLELEEKLVNFKHLLFTLAKRAISDIYYFLNSYSIYVKKTTFNFDKDIKVIFHEFIKILQEYKYVSEDIEVFKEYNDEISKFFPESSNTLGWKMNEFTVKQFFEESNQTVEISNFRRILKRAYGYKKTIEKNYKFLKFYYNDKDGKLYRLNFITDSLHKKLTDEKIKKDLFDSFNDIRENFVNYKNCFDNITLLEFGPNDFNYQQLLEFIYKGCKIVEFFYLRLSRYEELQTFRSEMLYYVEKEFYHYIEE